MRVPRTLLRAFMIGATAVATLVPACAAHADPTSKDVSAQIEQANNDLEDIIEAYNGINDKLSSTQAAMTDVTGRMHDLQGRLDTAYQDVQVVANAAYRGGGNFTALSALLSAGSADGLADQYTALRYVNRSRQHDIDEYTQLKTQLDGDQRHYDDLLKQQTDEQHKLADRKGSIESHIRDLEALKRKLNVPPPSSSSSRPSGPPPAVSGSAGKAVSFAYAQLDKPYVYGAAGPGSYDCSGLTMAAWAAAGVQLPHNAASQYSSMAHVSRSALQAGDLVFYRGLGHVGIYIGNNEIIHAPHTGDVVRVASVDIMPPYGYGRPG